MALDEGELDGDEIDISRPRKSKEYWDGCREGWKLHLEEFEKEMYYPVFAKFGISKGNAIFIWHMNCLKNMLEDYDVDNEDEEWDKK